MTKAKTPKGAPSWMSPGHALTKEAIAALGKALGYTSFDGLQSANLEKCLRGVEYWLGFYPGAVEAIDNAPTISVYRREIEAVRATAFELLHLVTSGTNPFTRDILNAHFEPAASITGLDKMAFEAANFLDACNSALQALAKEKYRGQGRKKAGARERVLANLVRLYGEYSKRQRGPRTKTGFAEKRTTFEQGEIDFVRAAFAEIKANPFGDDCRSDRRWASLIREAQTATAQQDTPRARKKAKK
jgi:hypothetical protein